MTEMRVWRQGRGSVLDGHGPLAGPVQLDIWVINGMFVATAQVGMGCQLHKVQSWCMMVIVDSSLYRCVER